MYMLPGQASQEVNLSLVWLILVIGFSFRLLLSLTGQYFEVQSFYFVAYLFDKETSIINIYLLKIHGS